MKQVLLIVLSTLFPLEIIAQDYLYGNDGLCPTEIRAQTKAPKGYKPFYLSHYGRHGARYAWDKAVYDNIKEVLDSAYAIGNLSPQGHDFKQHFDDLYPLVKYRAGDLSKKGWEQQKGLAKQMVTYYPEIFKNGADIQAFTSTSTRCIMSMSAFCLGLTEQNPSLKIQEHCGYSFLKGVLPLNHHNPFRNQDYSKTELLFDESLQHYVDRKIDVEPILERIFKDVNQALPEDKYWSFVSQLSTFANGMKSLDTEADFTDIFTVEERKALWQINNFKFYIGAIPDHKAYQTVINDIIQKAEYKIKTGKHGADLRFSHDDALLSLMILLGVDSFTTNIIKPDDVSRYCSMHNIPMGANLHFVLYKNKRLEKILFKVMLNGEETRISIPTNNWPFYDWEEFKNIHKQ